jgi:ribonucleoside-diphosphate reductase alpha chain
MKVVKRDGTYEDVSFDKVLRRIQLQCGDLTGVDAHNIAQKVCTRIYDGVKTSELDELAAQMCASLVTEHPDYGMLASRLIVSNHQKNTSPSFSETMSILFHARDVHEKHTPRISNELWEIVQAYKEKLNSVIDYERDFGFDYFGFKTLERSYLIKVDGKVVERPQHMWMRVALGIHGWDIKDAIETYNYMSTRFFTHATPTLFNAGTPRPQLSSCFLISMENDSINGIYNTLNDVAEISKNAGGIGLHIHQIRATGSHIRGTNGESTGIIPMLRVFNATARYVNQGGKRNGSIAVYLEPSHPDFEKFIDIRKNHGNMEERCLDLFTAAWIPDLFMRRVEANEDWSFFCPDECPGLADVYGEEYDRLYAQYEREGKARRTIKAQQLFMAIIKSQIETGTPYILFKDAANLKSNQKNLGTIKSSNLCVAPETMVLTEEGYFPISELAQRSDVRVWNGSEFSDVNVCQTGTMQKLLRVGFDNGLDLRCTPYHKFYIRDTETHQTKTVEAKDLTMGMRIIKHALPVLNVKTTDSMVAEPYTHGVFCASGMYTFSPIINLPRNKRNIIDHLDYVSYKKEANTFFISLKYDIEAKYFVPMNNDQYTKINWLEGLVDGCGKVANGVLQIKVQFAWFARTLVFFLQTLGVFSKTYTQNCSSYVEIDQSGLQNLQDLGFYPRHLDVSEVTAENNYDIVKVNKVEDIKECDDTYCFTEYIRHAGIFNGILTGQCSEILEYSSPDETAVCNLASIALPSFIEKDDNGNNMFNFEKLHMVAGIITKNLNKVIDRNFYPTKKCETSNLRHRPIGIGVQGLADTYAILRMPFDSKEAAHLNKQIFETIYHGSMTASMLIAKKRQQLRDELASPFTSESRKLEIKKHLHLTPEEEALTEFTGAYVTFKGSPTQHGLFQFDLWNEAPLGSWDWETLRQDVMKYGVRNSLLLAPMPTASTSQILGYNECMEPFTSNIYQRRTLAGEFTIINKYLIRDLLNLGIWSTDLKNRILIGNGSIQHLTEIPQWIRDLYKTAWELKQRVLIDQAADRGVYVCQTQSLNLFVEEPEFNKISNMHFYSWKKGLKTAMYYLRTRPKAKTIAFSIDATLAGERGSPKKEDEPVFVCRRDDPTCTMCSS